MSNAPHLKVNSGHAHHLLGIPSRNPPDAIVWRSVSGGQPESFFNLDLPIKYAPYPKLHGLRWRHKLPTNHAGAKTSQGRRSTARNTDTTGSAQAKHASPPLRFLLYLNPNGTHTHFHHNVAVVVNLQYLLQIRAQLVCFALVVLGKNNKKEK